MHLKIINNKESAQEIFTMALLYKDHNVNNYTEFQFNKAWPLWLNFYVLYNRDDPVAFCGIKKYEGGYARIFDRYFVFPKYRKKSLSDNEHSLFMIQKLVDDCNKEKLIPFFSIQYEKHRKALEIAVKKFNKCLYPHNTFHILDGMYCTVPERKNNINDLKCWQNIAVKYPHKINLEYKP
jgi:hypothetical protein